MNRLPIHQAPAVTESDWAAFPGGELEGKRPAALCPDCRGTLRLAAASGSRPARPALCFQCYRLELERTRALRGAAALDTASEARFQSLLPFEPVNRPRLARLKVERETARVAARAGAGLYIEKRRRAQIEARHALARIVHGIRERRVGHEAVPLLQRQPLAAPRVPARALEYPASWLPFVVAQ